MNKKLQSLILLLCSNIKFINIFFTKPKLTSQDQLNKAIIFYQSIKINLLYQRNRPEWFLDRKW
ncbi:MAG: hypothetical protein IPG78_19480 [Ignavibacteria bacterium]|nr:hypothetical protein [Ignavibacteria bacterium]